MVPPSITVCVTSCGRLDLLERTLSSFAQCNGDARLIISEDCADPDVISAVGDRYPQARLIYSHERVGLMRSIDRLYSAVETDFIFHLEDDWESDAPVNWPAAMSVLTERSDVVANVCVRHFDEIKPKYRERSVRFSAGGQDFALMNADAHPEFFGWSPNPGLISTELYRRYAPFEGYTADQLSGVVKRTGRRMAYMLPGVARHIGQKRTVTDPTLPPRPTTKIGKLKRSVCAKLYYFGLRKTPF